MADSRTGNEASCGISLNVEFDDQVHRFSIEKSIKTRIGPKALRDGLENLKLPGPNEFRPMSRTRFLPIKFPRRSRTAHQAETLQGNWNMKEGIHPEYREVVFQDT